MNHYDYMSLAMQEAKKALASGEIPIGAIIVLHDSVIAADTCHKKSFCNIRKLAFDWM